jgi:hypothetical protein
MKTNFVVHRKVMVWVEEYHSVDTGDREKAKSIMRKAIDSGDTSDTFIQQEIIYDTMIDMDKQSNFGNDVVELYFEGDTSYPVYSK